MQILIQVLLLLLLVALLSLVLLAVQKLRRHGLSPTHFLFCTSFSRALGMLLNLLFLLVLNAFHAELVGHSVVDLARWQLEILMLLSRSVMHVKHFQIGIII